MALTNSNLNKLLTRSKQIIAQVKKAKHDLTYKQLPSTKSIPKVQSHNHSRRNPIFKLSSSKGFSDNKPMKQLRINTLPDYIDDTGFNEEYQTPKFSSQYTVKIENRERVKKQERIEDMFSTFGFKKDKGLGKTEKSVKLKGKENRDCSEQRGNIDDGKERQNGKERDGKKQAQKKFLSTINFGTKKLKERKTEIGKTNTSSRRFL